MEDTVPIYTTDDEYRAVICRFLNIPSVENMEECMEQLDKHVGTIYERTKENPLFIRVFELASARFMSLDHEIGICILLSYQLFPFFYNVWVDFKKGGFTETSESYLKLLEVLQQKERVTIELE